VAKTALIWEKQSQSGKSLAGLLSGRPDKGKKIFVFTGLEVKIRKCTVKGKDKSGAAGDVL